MKTAEERKIARLEKQVQDLKEENQRLELQCNRLNFNVQAERQWRMDFQRLMKSASQEDNLQEYNRY